MSNHAVGVALPPEAPRARYALATLLHLLGVEWQDAASGVREADISYGSAQPARVVIPAGPQDGWDDPRPALRHDNGLPILHRPGPPASAAGAGGVLSFDLLYATYACLTGPWEAVDPKDEVDCPIAAEGWLAEHELLHEPLVHRYAEVLARALQAIGVTAGLPETKIVVTHDVDFNFGHLFWARESLVHFRREARARQLSALRRGAGLVRRGGRQATRTNDPNDRWDEWTALLDRFGTRPAYFVASYGLFDEGASRYDPPYDSRHPRVMAELRRLEGEGAEIGIHFSLEARSSAERVRDEVQRLSEIVNAPVRSARHHWWALGAKAERTLWAHASAGIEVDCSFGFNDRTGFRRGIAFPFRPFDRERLEPLPLWSLPTSAMDIALFKPGASPAGSAQELASLLDATRRFGGCLVLNWHGHALNPRVPHGVRDGLLAFLDGIKGAHPPFETPLQAAAAASRRHGAIA